MLYLYVMLIAYAALSFTCATLILALASDVSHVAKARRQARLFRAQQKWAEEMDCHDIGPRG